MLVISILFAIIQGAFRFQATPALTYWLLYTASLLAAALWALFRTKRHFLSVEDALIQLESTHQLNSTLSIAHAGFAAWPSLPSKFQDGFQWNSRKIIPSLFGSMVVLLLAATLPRSTANGTRIPADAELPLPLAEVENWVEDLTQDPLIEEQSLEELKKQLEDLKTKSSEQWYDHNNLEAADNLNEKTKRSLESNLENLEKLNQALSGLTAQDKLSQSQRNELRNEAQKALSNLESGSLPLDKNFLDQFGDFSSDTLQGAPLEKLSPGLESKMQQLNKLLGKEGAKGQESAGGSCSGSNGEAPMCQSDKQGMNPGSGQGEESGSQKSGGIPGRGPGEAPLNLKERAPQLTSSLTERLRHQQNRDDDLGETVGVTAKAPDEPIGASNGPEEAGSTTEGGSGSSVWRGSFTPDEKRILEQYFK